LATNPTGDTIVGEITVFGCLNCIFECINGFTAPEKLKYAIPTISDWGHSDYVDLDN
jgi:hypothetical protein